MKKILACLTIFAMVFLIGCKADKAEPTANELQNEGADVGDSGLDELTNELESDLSGDGLDTSDLDNLDEELNLDWLE